MKWVLSQHSTALLWLNAPIIGGWAVLFTPRKYIFLFLLSRVVWSVGLDVSRVYCRDPLWEKGF